VMLPSAKNSHKDFLGAFFPIARPVFSAAYANSFRC
jgi:hypothetical protein